MPLGGLLTAGLAPVAGGLIGNIAGSGDRANAQAAQQAALAAIMGVNTPDINQMQLQLQQYGLAGQLSPMQEATMNQQQSGMNNISTDPRLMQAQMTALSKLQQQGNGGLQPQDQAALAQIMNSNAANAHAADSSIMQNMQQRGIATQGSELAQRLASAQGAAQNANAQGLDLAGQAAQRSLQNIAASGQLGGQMQAQQFGQAAQTANAQDAINRFNTSNAQQIAGVNTQNANNAQAANLAAKQGVMNQNTALSNQQQQYNKQLLQQQYEDQLQKAQGVYGAQNNAANQQNQQAAQQQSLWGGVGSGIGGAAAAYGTQQNNQNFWKTLYGGGGGTTTPAGSTAGTDPQYYENNGNPANNSG